MSGHVSSHGVGTVSAPNTAQVRACAAPELPRSVSFSQIKSATCGIVLAEQQQDMLKPNPQFGSDQLSFPFERKSKAFMEEEAFLQEYGLPAHGPFWGLASLTDTEYQPPKSWIRRIHLAAIIPILRRKLAGGRTT